MYFDFWNRLRGVIQACNRRTDTQNLR